MPGTIYDVWAEEQAYLMTPARPFDGFVEHTKRVTPTCLIHLERNRYTCLTKLAQHLPIQKVSWWAGHSNIQITMMRYAHLQQSDLMDCVDVLETV